jgi:hypothetical protein
MSSVNVQGATAHKVLSMELRVDPSRVRQASSEFLQNYKSEVERSVSAAPVKSGVAGANPSLNIVTGPRQNSEPSQNSAAPVESPQTKPPAPAATHAPPAESPQTKPAGPLPVPPANLPQQAAPVSTVPGATHWYASDARDDAYWAAQPPEVRQLREIDNIDQRKVLGQQLAGEGFKIDTPIMIWGWDAGKVTDMRHANGYTWVPSASQPSVTAAPGMGGGGIQMYDPMNPPPGSIMV